MRTTEMIVIVIMIATIAIFLIDDRRQRRSRHWDGRTGPLAHVLPTARVQRARGGPRRMLNCAGAYEAEGAWYDCGSGSISRSLCSES